MNAKAKKFIIKRGRNLLKKIQVLMGRYSLVGDQEFFFTRAVPVVREAGGELGGDSAGAG